MFKKISAALLSAAVIAAGIPAGIPVGRAESVPAADLFDLQIAESGTLQDGGTYQLPLTFSGSYSAGNRTAANADGSYTGPAFVKSANRYAGLCADYSGQAGAVKAAMNDGFTVSVLFALDEVLSGECTLLGNAQSGGFTLVTMDGYIQFILHVGGRYVTVQSQTQVQAGTLYAAAGVYNPDDGALSVYINGRLEASVSAAGSITHNLTAYGVAGIPRKAEDGNGYDGVAVTGLTSPKGAFFSARVYSGILTAGQILAAYLKDLALEELPVPQSVKEVMRLIDAIGTVTADSDEAITAAENAYAALGDTEKKLVENYAVLTEARLQYRILTAAPAAFDENRIALRFGVMTDIHLGPDGAEARFQKAIDTLDAFAGGKPDALVMAGDYTYEGKREEAQLLFDQLRDNYDPEQTAMVIAYGNHDTYWSGCMDTEGWYDVLKDLFCFQAEDSQPRKGNHHVVVGGCHFLTIQTASYSPNRFSEDTMTWLKNTLDAITRENPHQPVFIATHGPNANTVYGSSDALDGAVAPWGYTTQLEPLLSQYPQVILFSGHTHYGVTLERAIMQTGFTSVQAGSVTGLGSMEPVDAANYLNPADPAYTSTAQGLLAEVDAHGNSRLTRIDFSRGEKIGEPWIVPAPDDNGDHLLYYTALRGKTAAPTLNASGAAARPIGENGAEIVFDRPQDGALVFSYSYTFYHDGEKVQTLNVLDDWWNYPDPADAPAQVAQRFSSLQVQRPFTVKITATDEWGNTSEAITAVVEDNEESARRLAAAVDEKIRSIGGITLDSRPALQAARAAYNELTALGRQYVTLADQLAAAEKAYQNLWMPDPFLTMDGITGGNFWPSMLTLTEKENGVHYRFASTNYGVRAGFAEAVRLDGTHLRLDNLAVDKYGARPILALGLSSTVCDPEGYGDGAYALLCLNFADGKVTVYPTSGGTVIMESSLLTGSSLSGVVDIRFARNAAGEMEMTIETTSGQVRGVIPASCLAATTLTDLDHVYITLESWTSDSAYQFDVVSFHGGETRCLTGYTKADADAAAQADALIASIGEVTRESLGAIEKAEAAYAALSASARELVGNYDTLRQARAAYDALPDAPVQPDTPAGPDTPAQPDTPATGRRLPWFALLLLCAAVFSLIQIRRHRFSI